MMDITPVITLVWGFTAKGNRGSFGVMETVCILMPITWKCSFDKTHQSVVMF